MEIRIVLDTADPPTGRLYRIVAGRAQTDPIIFSGWLGLLRALSDAIGTE
jgi:hypothetical protein